MSTLNEFRTALEAIVKILPNRYYSYETDDYFREIYSKEPETYICPFERFGTVNHSDSKTIPRVKMSFTDTIFLTGLNILNSQLERATTDEEKSKIHLQIDRINTKQKEMNDMPKYETNEQKRLADYKIYLAKTNEKHRLKVENWKEEKSMWIPKSLNNDDVKQLFDEYHINHKSVINKIIKNYQPYWSPFNPTISLRKDFAMTITSNEKIADCIIQAMEDPNASNRREILMEYDFNIEELLEVTEIFVNPPYPLVNCNHEDENNNDPTQQFNIVSNENLRFVIQATKNNFVGDELVQPETVSLTFKLPDGQMTELVSSNVMKCYPSIDTSKVIEVSNKTVKCLFIKSLYTGTFDRNISNDYVDELLKLFSKADLASFITLCWLAKDIRCITSDLIED